MNTTASKIIFITGATGLVGSHATEEALKRGHRVRALVRPTSDTRWLDQWGVETIVGDLEDPRAMRAGVAGADWVFNCAAKVGDWGTLEEFRRLNVEALRLLLDAASASKLERFVHVSSLGVYEGRDHHGTDETVPPAANSLDAYTRSKTEAEALVLEYHRRHGLPAAIVRPGFIYGERDRTVLPKLLLNLRRGSFAYFGSGDQVLNCIYVKNLVHGIFLAAENHGAVGEVFQPDRRPASDQETVRRPGCRAGRHEAPDAAHPARVGSIPRQHLRMRSQALGRQEPADHQQGTFQVPGAEPRLLDRKGTPRARLSATFYLRTGNRAGHDRTPLIRCPGNCGRGDVLKGLEKSLSKDITKGDSS
jgi:nucleoside-diphosphate-sugar epimerase